jgi:hypothetical protein
MFRIPQRLLKSGSRARLALMLAPALGARAALEISAAGRRRENSAGGRHGICLGCSGNGRAMSSQ